MSRQVRLIVGLVLVLGYLLCLPVLFHANTLTPASVDSVPTDGVIAEVHGNGKLQALIIFDSKRAKTIDATNEIKVSNLEVGDDAARFTSGMLTPSGTAYLLDDKNRVYRQPMGHDFIVSKPLKIDGDILAIAAEDKNGILWCAARRHTPAPDALMVYAINLQNGKTLASVNLGAQDGNASFDTSASNGGVLLTASATPGAFLFKYEFASITSHYLALDDLVTSTAFDGDDPILGTRSGSAITFDSKTGKQLRSYQTNSLSASFVSSEDGTLGIGHAAGTATVGGGSFQTVEMATGDITGECAAHAMVSSGSATHNMSGFVYGLESGQIALVTSDKGCEALESPKDAKPGSIRLIACQWPICLAIGTKQIERIAFKSK